MAPEASIAFVFSPLVGSPITTSAKFAVVSKSPLTHRINDSLASSMFAIAGKKSGCDAIVLTGRASRPSILVINNGEVCLEAAEDLWGADCSVAQHRLQERYGADSAVAVIGPAGERMIHYATISHDGRHAGRGGSGAVLGSKNIKAIVVRGSQRCTWAHPQELTSLAKAISKKSFGPATAKYRELGTAANLLIFNRLNALPTLNFQRGSFEQAAALAPDALAFARNKTQASCAACTIGCEHIYSIGGKDAKADGVRIEYENLFALGSLCGVGDSQIVLQASKRCDELGIDTISTGSTIAFAMECAERGLHNETWLQFGDGQALLQAIEQIGCLEGFGKQLALGTRRLAEHIGQGSAAFAPQVKGLELPGYEPRTLQTMALGFAVGTRGADHNRSGAYEVDFSQRADRRNLTPESARLAVETEDQAALMDSLILCKFLRGIFEDFFAEAAQMLHFTTGWEITSGELRQTSRRIVTAKKLFNLQAGWTPAEDTLPNRFFDQPLPDDDSARLTRPQLAEAIKAYNQQRDWSDDGLPSNNIYFMWLYSTNFKAFLKLPLWLTPASAITKQGSR
ncbi:MAG: aldehyde:ferredoxin oxidoreductase [Bacteroidetes bacterium]|nr:aldehyde:ferredoxin oxidoreductase [Bacteroidota bacterium]